MNHTLYQYKHTYRTKAQGAHSPTISVSVIASHIQPHIISHLTDRKFGHKAKLASEYSHGTNFPGTFRGKATPPSLGIPAVYIFMAICLHMCGS